MINKNLAIKYCKNDISLIENYDKAIADTTQVWHCHHRRETVMSRKDLIEIGEYYNRPAIELIFLTKSEHNRLHKSGENHPLFGKPSVFKGKHHSAESIKKMSDAHKGKRFSESHKKKISETLKGKHWYNNGVISVLAKECPEGFVKWSIKK